MSVHEHRELAARSVACAILTISDTRTEATDASGKLMSDLLTQAGHTVARRIIVKDDPGAIRRVIDEQAARGDVQAVLLNGGTGISRRDSTFEAVDALLEKRLTGFGELFRQLSFAEVGAAAMLSRACAGAYGDLILFSVPGSPAAVRLAMEKLILPELAHVVWEIWRQKDGATSHGCKHKPAAPPAQPAAAFQPEPFRPETRAVFNAQKMGKATLFESPRLLVGLNCFEPGQEHALHAHAGMDKVYHVLQGEGLFLLEGRELPMTPGTMLIAPENMPHGIRNTGKERLVVLAVLAPGPGPG
jgi:molybdenum cofactor biosynthesis protein B